MLFIHHSSLSFTQLKFDMQDSYLTFHHLVVVISHVVHGASDVCMLCCTN